MPSSVALAYTVYDATGAIDTTTPLTLATSNGSVATVASTGLRSALVTAAGVGTADITGTNAALGGISAVCHITVITSYGVVVIPSGNYLEGTVAGLGFALPQVSLKMRFLVDAIKGLGASSTRGLCQLAQDYPHSGTLLNSVLATTATTDGSGNYTLAVIGGATFTQTQASLPALGTFVTLYVSYDNTVSGSPLIVELLDDAGTSYGSNTYATGGAIGFFPTSPTTTFFYLGASDTLYTSSGTTEGGLSVDGAAVYAGVLSGPARYSAPAATDPNIVGLYGFAGVLTSDAGLGGALGAFTFAPSGVKGAGTNTYIGGGIWT